MLLIYLAIHNIIKPSVKLIEKKEIISTIDSVWFTSPGQENTLQTDYHYYGKASNGQVIVSTDKSFHIGDSIICIYYRYENTKIQKK
jgi:uncharacterized protein YegP (UPF0339 family)